MALSLEDVDKRILNSRNRILRLEQRLRWSGRRLANLRPRLEAGKSAWMREYNDRNNFGEQATDYQWLQFRRQVYGLEHGHAVDLQRLALERQHLKRLGVVRSALSRERAQVLSRLSSVLPIDIVKYGVYPFLRG